MRKRTGRSSRSGVSVLCGLLLSLSLSGAQENEPGRSIGQVSTNGDLIIMEMDGGVLGKPNLFDLTGRTLRFTPEGSRYRVESRPLRWDADFGPEAAGAEATLHGFAFPFSGKQWKSFLVGMTGSIRFGASEKDISPDPYGKKDGGVVLGRFDQLTEAAPKLIGGTPAICVFLKPRMSGPHYVKELQDRVVITWDLTEPFGSLLDFTWFKTVNRFQAVLHRDGSIEMSYKELAAKDAIVGVYPALPGVERPLATIAAGAHPALPPHLDVRRVRLSIVDGSLLRVTFETRGPVPLKGDGGYSVHFKARTWTADWVIEGTGVSGPGAFPKARISGNSMTVQGILPAAGQVEVSAEVTAGEPAKVVERVPPHAVRLSGIRNPEVHFSSLTRKSGPFAVVYEAFHYLALPRSQDLACTVIKALGDRFDFLAYYSDFRIDSQEASSPSYGPAAGNVTGIGLKQHDLETYCSQGRFQWAFAQPVYAGSNEMQERPPEGAPVRSNRDITFYARQLAGSSLPYNYAVGHLGHEMSHRWLAYVPAKVNGEKISLGPWPHWDRGLQASVAFPYSQPTEASTQGGGVWQDNSDGTYTQLHDGYFVPATGYSYLDLYLMGFLSAAEVPDFFLLKNLVPAGKDANGHPIFKADRTKVTIQDVIAAEGRRTPDAEQSQKKFNTGIVVIVEHGKNPSRELIERANGIRRQWIQYWDAVTGRRSSMTVNPH